MLPSKLSSMLFIWLEHMNYFTQLHVGQLFVSLFIFISNKSLNKVTKLYPLTEAGDLMFCF